MSKKENTDTKDKVEETFDLEQEVPGDEQPPAKEPTEKKSEVVSKEELEELYKEVAGSKDSDVDKAEVARKAIEEYKKREQKAATEAAKDKKIEQLEQQMQKLTQSLESQGQGRRSQVPSNNQTLGQQAQSSEGDSPMKIHRKDFDRAVSNFLKTPALPNNGR